MRVTKRIILIAGISLFGVGLILFVIGYFRPKNAGIHIETDPGALVYINGEQVGRTPYEAVLTPGEITLSLVPEALGEPLVPFETKVSLTSGIKTVVRREFGESEEASSGEVISFEKGVRGETSLAVVSIPDSAEIVLDGSTVGFTPYKTSAVAPRSHQLAILAEGFKERTIQVNAVEGYKLTVFVKLAVDPAFKKEEPPVEEKVKVVKILDTPTGFLRVREEPSVLSQEVGQVTPGQTFPFLEEDEESGWLKIEFQEKEASGPEQTSGEQSRTSRTGWVSGDYVQVTEEVLTPSPSPKPES